MSNMTEERSLTIILYRKLDRLFAKIDDAEEKPVKLVWARPITGHGQEISIVGEDKKEICLLKSLDGLDPHSRRIAEEELERRYLVPRITRVIGTKPSYGNRYWHVETDRGQRHFVMKDPSKNVVWVTHDRLIIRDTLGNRYQIESLSRLDAHSRAEVEKVT